MRRFGAAIFAYPEYREMVEIRLETMALSNMFAYSVQVAIFKRSHALAHAADQMVMSGLANPLVHGLGGAHVRFGNQAFVFQDGQGPVHRRRIDERVRLFNLLDDLC
jgi:predicted NodU family carbamoyl transferase